MPGIAPSPVRVAPVDDTTADAVRALQVAADQRPYVGDTAFNLADTRRDPMSEAMAVLVGDTVVGFYRLDFAPTAIIGRALDTPGVGLRAFMIDRARQGRGYGTQAMAACCDDLRRRHPHRRQLLLTVNCRNLAALAMYRKAGCIDTGELYAGGHAGPQHLLLRPLHSPDCH